MITLSLKQAWEQIRAIKYNLHTPMSVCMYTLLEFNMLTINFVVESGDIENRSGVSLASKYDNQLGDRPEYFYAGHCHATI